MSTNHFPFGLLTPRQPVRRRRAARRGSARRGWLVQKLEPRCVMAADLLLGIEPTAFALTESTSQTSVIEAPASWSSSKVADDPSLSDESQPPPLDWTSDETIADQTLAEEIMVEEIMVEEIIVDESIADEMLTEIVAIVGTPDQSMELTVHQGQALTLNLDPSQLDAWFGQDERVAVHVVYDATRWQVVATPDQGNEVGAADGDVRAASRHIDGQIQLVALVDHSVQIHIEIQQDSTDQGVPTQVVVKLVDGESSDGAGPTKWVMEEFSFVHQWGSMETPPGIGNETSQLPAGDGRAQEDFSTTLDPSGKSEHETDAPSGVWTGEVPGDAQPLVDDEASPLPETRHEVTERNTRTARRTLDISSPNSAAWTSSANSKRLAVTPGSLATQNLIASAYDDAAATGFEQVRSTLDPKPARLQMATFVLSRVDQNETSVVMKSNMSATNKPAQPTTQPALAERSTSQTNTQSSSHPSPQASLPSRAPSRSQSSAQPKRTASHAEHDESLMRIVAVPDDAEVTMDDQPRMRDAILPEELSSETDDQRSLIAGVADRFFGSPISVLAVLGLTIIARFSELDTSIQPIRD